MPFPLSNRSREPQGEQLPEGVRVPSFVCDYCGRPILHLADGVYLIQEQGDPLGPATALFAHRDRTDDSGGLVERCHARLEEDLGVSGWLELRDFVARLVLGVAGARETVAGALGLTLRDVWLLRWLAEGEPSEPLAGQPKAWRFARADVKELASRLGASVSKRSPAGPGDDDLKVWLNEP
ncbi:MAG: hypothetical protein IT352_16965 [Gemmatimonadales bacterium]|nr:hypothetical protein [Gemmatimonadales bacterium]